VSVLENGNKKIIPNPYKAPFCVALTRAFSSAAQLAAPLDEGKVDQKIPQDFMDEIHWLFHSEPDDDGIFQREFPNKRIREHHSLDVSYMDFFDWEGSSKNNEGSQKHRRVKSQQSTEIVNC
jgi:hypothetical protein